MNPTVSVNNRFSEDPINLLVVVESVEKRRPSTSTWDLHNAFKIADLPAFV